MDSGTVLRLERTSIYDGEGFRTVVYLKGCPLRCKWCSTPESAGKGLYNGYGRRMSVREVMREVEKDEVFYFHSNGGVTLSGGEVLMQADFAAEILAKCKEVCISTAVETSLYAPYGELQKLAPHLDMLYADMKLMDESEHRHWTGVSNAIIQRNLRQFAADYPQTPIHARVPLIPGVNAQADNLERTAEFCAALPSVVDVELLPYHRFGMDTYNKLGLQYELAELVPPAKDETFAAAAAMAAFAPGLKVLALGQEFSA